MPPHPKIILFLLSICILTNVQAQRAPRLRNFQPLEYGGQSQNWSVAQSTEGWISVGNNGALLMFDGIRWDYYELPEKQPVRAVAAGRDGLVFCGGYAEFGYWSRDSSGQLTYSSLSAQLADDQVEKDEIWHILVLPDYVLFQSFSKLYKFDYEKVLTIIPPSSIMFAQGINGQVIVPVIGQGLYELLADNTFRAIAGSEVLSNMIVQFLVPNGRGGIWAGTSSDGIFELQDGQCRPWNHPLNAAFRKKQLNKAIPLKRGGWAIGTILDGVYIVQKSGQLSCHLNRENGLQNNTVLALLEDRDGNLWIGLDRGVDFAVLRSPLTFFSDQSGKIGTVYSAAQHAGQLYLGTNQGVFRTPYPSELSVPPISLVEGTQGQVWQLKVFSNQLICGHNSGTFIINGNAVRRISAVTGGWWTIEVPGHPNTLLQATYTGLVLLRKTGNGAWDFAGRVEGFEEPVKKIAFDKAGNLWATHPNKGLFCLRLNEDQSRVTTFKRMSTVDGLVSDVHLTLSVLPDSGLLVNAFPRALLIKSASGGPVSFEPVDASMYLPGHSGEVFSLDSNNLWIHRPNAPAQKIPISLVPAYENIEKLSGGDYLFCLENGYALLKRGNAVPPLSLENVPAVAITLFHGQEGQAYSLLESPTLSFEDNSLTFQFAQPYYEQQVRFSWFLEGFSKSWSPWSLAAEKEFTNLPAGHYTFRVRSDIGGDMAVFSFRIAPPWYLSGWAILAYILIFLSMIWLFELYNRRRLRLQRRHLETEKEREILVLEVENKSRELSNAALNLIRKNEALQSLKDNLKKAKNEPLALPKIIREIDAHLDGDHDWELFEASFNQVHDDFFKRLRLTFPELTPGDMRLAAYLKMNLSSKEIAPLLNISIRGIENKRYRLRKKLDLPEDANLTEYIMAF